MRHSFVAWVDIFGGGRFLLLAIAALSSFGCSGNGSGEQTYGITGSVQKGPFDIGATIDLQVLDGDLDPTGRTFGTTTIDSFGSFAIPENITSPRVQLIATGFYFDEIDAQASAAQLTLRAYANLAEDEVVNANVLTDLASRRITNLVQAGSSFSDAEAQARGEVSAVFRLTSAAGIAFDNMDISESGDANAFLLATSTILLEMAHQQAPTAIVAELSARLAAIGTDLATDGLVTDSSMMFALTQASIGVGSKLETIRTNLETHYGAGVAIPGFEDFVDNDGDGVLNRHDPSFPMGGVPPFTTGILVRVTWEADPRDVDLHFVDVTAGGQFYQSPYDCHYANLNPDWGAPGSDGDPVLGGDGTSGPGPEFVQLENPDPAHSYQIFVHYFSDDGLGPTNPQARVQTDTVDVVLATPTALTMNKVWAVGLVSSSGAFIPDGTIFQNPYSY